jgi:hypothetical protein
MPNSGKTIGTIIGDCFFLSPPHSQSMYYKYKLRGLYIVVLGTGISFANIYNKTVDKNTTSSCIMTYIFPTTAVHSWWSWNRKLKPTEQTTSGILCNILGGFRQIVYTTMILHVCFKAKISRYLKLLDCAVTAVVETAQIVDTLILQVICWMRSHCGSLACRGGHGR